MQALGEIEREPSLDQAVEWRPLLWVPAARSLFARAAPYLVPKARVLEFGYGSGMMSCYLAANFGVSVTGVEVDARWRAVAEKKALRYGVGNRTEFLVRTPDELSALPGGYDLIFIKSFMYHVQDPASYREWLEFFRRLLLPHGCLLALENGRGGWLDSFYRSRIKHFRWAEFMLFDRTCREQLDEVFGWVDAEYFGRMSQFFCFSPRLFGAARFLEDRIRPPDARHCFVASVVAGKR